MCGGPRECGGSGPLLPQFGLGPAAPPGLSSEVAGGDAGKPEPAGRCPAVPAGPGESRGLRRRWHRGPVGAEGERLGGDSGRRTGSGSRGDCGLWAAGRPWCCGNSDRRAGEAELPALSGGGGTFGPAAGSNGWGRNSFQLCIDGNNSWKLMVLHLFQIALAMQ